MVVMVRTCIGQPFGGSECAPGGGKCHAGRHGSLRRILRFSLAGERLSRAEVLDYLKSYHEVVAAYIDELYGYTERSAGPENFYGSLALYQGIRGFESELEWTRWAATEVKRADKGSRKTRPRR